MFHLLSIFNTAMDQLYRFVIPGCTIARLRFWFLVVVAIVCNVVVMLLYRRATHYTLKPDDKIR